MYHQPDKLDQSTRGLKHLTNLQITVFFLPSHWDQSAQKSLARNRMTPWWPEGSTACMEWDERMRLSCAGPVCSELFFFFFGGEHWNEGLHALEWAGPLLHTVTNVWFRIKNQSSKGLNHLTGRIKSKPILNLRNVVFIVIEEVPFPSDTCLSSFISCQFHGLS